MSSSVSAFSGEDISGRASDSMSIPIPGERINFEEAKVIIRAIKRMSNRATASTEISVFLTLEDVFTIVMAYLLLPSICRFSCSGIPRIMKIIISFADQSISWAIALTLLFKKLYPSHASIAISNPNAVDSNAL